MGAAGRTNLRGGTPPGFGTTAFPALPAGFLGGVPRGGRPDGDLDLICSSFCRGRPESRTCAFASRCAGALVRALPVGHLGGTGLPDRFRPFRCRQAYLEVSFHARSAAAEWRSRVETIACTSRSHYSRSVRRELGLPAGPGRVYPGCRLGVLLALLGRRRREPAGGGPAALPAEGAGRFRQLRRGGPGGPRAGRSRSRRRPRPLGRQRLDGPLRYFVNTRSAASPAFIEATGLWSPFAAIDVGEDSKPALADLDGDGDRDLAVGEVGGGLLYFRNSGTPAVPAFVAVTGTANPFAGDRRGRLQQPGFRRSRRRRRPRPGARQQRRQPALLRQYRQRRQPGLPRAHRHRQSLRPGQRRRPQRAGAGGSRRRRRPRPRPGRRQRQRLLFPEQRQLFGAGLRRAGGRGEPGGRARGRAAQRARAGRPRRRRRSRRAGRRAVGRIPPFPQYRQRQRAAVPRPGLVEPLRGHRFRRHLRAARRRAISTATAISTWWWPTIYGHLRFFANTGSSAAPALAERTGTANPFRQLRAGHST